MTNNSTTTTITGTKSIGRFVFSYKIDTVTNEITVDTSFDDVKLGINTLTPENSNKEFFKNLGIQILEGSLSANFQTSELSCMVEITINGEVVYENRGTLVRW